MSLQENRFNLYEDVTAQGWNRYFDRLLGPTFPILVKEFWIHATSSNHQVTSYVMGKKIVITEDLIGKLIGYNGGGVRCIDMADRCSDLKLIAKEIFSSEHPSSKIIDLKDHHRIWARNHSGMYQSQEAYKLS